MHSGPQIFHMHYPLLILIKKQQNNNKNIPGKYCYYTDEEIEAKRIWRFAQDVTAGGRWAWGASLASDRCSW